MVKIKSLPKHEMPREKLAEKGAAGMKDKELLAIILRTGMKGKNVLEVADGILKKFPMKKLLKLDLDDLSKIRGVGPGKATTLVASFELVKRALEVEDSNLPIINTAKEALAQLQELRTAKKEHFVVLYLDARNQLIHKETISIGTLNASLVHAREVFKPAIDHLSASIILAHNHPSGDTEPSQADIEITKKIVHSGKILDIPVNDHIIVTNNSHKSIIAAI